MSRIEATELQEAMQGYWPDYFQSTFDINVDEMHSVPCPICGGTNRFDWTNFKESGGYHCRGEHSGKAARNGFYFAQELWKHCLGYDLSFPEILEEVQGWLNRFNETYTRRPARQVSTPSPEAVESLSKLLKSGGSWWETTTHPYLTSEAKQQVIKAVPSGSRESFVATYKGQSVIVVPYRAATDPLGEVIGAELIAANGFKWSPKGFKRGVHLMQQKHIANGIVLVEGWASALATAYLLQQHDLNLAVAAVGGKGNLKTAAASLSLTLSTKTHIAWEQDTEHQNQTGLTLPRTAEGNDPADWIDNPVAVQEFISKVKDM